MSGVAERKFLGPIRPKRQQAGNLLAQLRKIVSDASPLFGQNFGPHNQFHHFLSRKRKKMLAVAQSEVASFPLPAEEQKGNSKAACTNCRQSHVACSHELPCSRCKVIFRQKKKKNEKRCVCISNNKPVFKKKTKKQKKDSRLGWFLPLFATQTKNRL